MSQHRVFVYGTLMQGLRNHHLMSAAKFSGSAKTLLPSYSLVQFPSESSPGNVTPGMKKHGTDCVVGELYIVDDESLARLDQLEQNGVEYERSRVMLDDGSQAWAYFLIAKKQECAKGTPNFIRNVVETQSVFWDGTEEERVMRKSA